MVLKFLKYGQNLILFVKYAHNFFFHVLINPGTLVKQLKKLSKQNMKNLTLHAKSGPETN